MLAFLVLCAFLQTLRGASVAPPHVYSSVAAAVVSGAMAREAPIAPEDGGQQFRTVYTIVKSCLLTIFACVWTSAHPNINGPRDSGWTRLKRKAVTMLSMVIAPELVLYWALCQRKAAKEIAEEYNKEFAKSGDTETSLCGKIVGWFQTLPRGTTRRGDGQSWTQTHGFFIQMGGFILYENEYTKEVLDYKRLAELLQKRYIDAPTVTERDLQDRSKGDAISKGIVVVQTTWFVLQCFARWGKRLPLSELEVLTLAFAVMNAAIYAAWWDKPQGVDMAVLVPLKTEEKEVNDPTTPLMGEEPHELENLSHLEYMSNDLPRISHEPQPDEHTGEKHSWLRRTVRKDGKKYDSPFFVLFRVPYRIVGSVIRLLGKMGFASVSTFKKENLRLPMFYASGVGSQSTVIASCVIGTIFGAIHLLAWTSIFPSHRDLILWRVSALVLTVSSFLIPLASAIDALGVGVIAVYITLLVLPMIPIYIVARFVLISIALKAIRDPPYDVLLDVSWTSYLPHF